MVKRRHSIANSIFCFLTFSILAFGQTLTTVRDEVTNPDGTTFSGTLQLTWVGGPGSSISPTTTSAHLYTGVFTALLVPTTTVNPCAYYTAQFTSSDGSSQWTENWYVPPSSGILTIAQITTPNAACGNGGSGGGGVTPSAPTTLVATSVSTSQIDLAWSGTPGVTYNVYASTLSGFTPTGGSQIATGLTSASYQSSGLSASTTYYYLVTAVNASGESLPSNSANATTQATSANAPASPTGLAATALASNQINLSWSASSTSGVTYNVYGSTSAGVSATAPNRLASGLSATSYQSTGLGASTAYYYLVTAVNSAGESAPSNGASATTQAASGGSGSLTLPIPISDVANLSNILAAKPNVGTSYTSGSAAMIDSSGNIGSVSGASTNCVLVNGTSAPCGSTSLPIQITNVTNLASTLASLTTDFTTVTNTASTQAASIIAIQTAASTLGNTVSTQGTNLSSLNGTVSTLSASVSTQGTNLSTLSTTVSSLPVKGIGITSGRTAFIDASGDLNSVVGNAGDCVHVDGSSGSCGSGGSGGSTNSLSVSFIDAETPGGTLDGSNTSFTLAQTPLPATSLEVFRNGALQQAGIDFSLTSNTLTFLSASVPQPSDILTAYYRVNGSAQTVTFVDGETPGGTMDGVNTAYTLANVPASGLRLYKNGALLLLNTDFTISGANLTFISGSQPFATDILLAYYRY